MSGRVLALALGIALGGCRDDAASADVDPDGGSTGDDDDGGDGGGSDDGGDTGESDDPDEQACAPEIPTPLRRLTAAEYVHSVEDLLGVDAGDVVAALPVDATVHGFSNNASVQSFLLAHARAYQDAAEAVADRFVANGLECTPAPGDPSDPCLRGFIETFAGAAYRRPPDEHSVDGLAELAASTESTEALAGVALVVRAVLQSPRFLFRVERGIPDGDRIRLDGWEIATRLSYLLWQTTPDPWLLQHAADGSLDTAEGVAMVAAQMLEQPAIDRSLAELSRGWLRLDLLDDASRPPGTYPQWSPALREAMRAEVAAMMRDAAVGPGTLADLWTGRTAWVDAQLAELYDLPAPAGDGLQPVTLPDGDDRGGLLGTAAFLALTTPSDITSPVRRGMFVWDAILCTPLPPPPDDAVGELPPPGPMTKAEALEQHRSDPACSVCHDLLDPIGLGLERYDALGRRRTLDEGGAPVEQVGAVPLDEPRSFGGAAELGAILGDLDQTRRCFATQVFRFSHGRTETPDDACTIHALRDAGDDFPALVRALVTSDAFRFRTP